MVPLSVWITRPDSHEILMGGDRHLKVWFNRPAYIHHPQTYETGRGEYKFVDQGWRADSDDYGKDVKPLLKQDPELRKLIWQEVYLSVGPRGMSIPEIEAWEVIVTKPDPEFPTTNWHNLTDDREWEGKCNTCHKRFLLEVDLRSNTVKRIIPSVVYRQEPGQPPSKWIETDECPYELAFEYYHKPNGLEIPF